MSGAERTELREVAARAAFDAFYAEDTEYSEIERAMFLQVADAVLSVLPGTDAEDAAAIRRVLEVVAIVRDSVDEDEKGGFYFVPTAEELFDEVQKTVTDDDVARLERMGQG